MYPGAPRPVVNDMMVGPRPPVLKPGGPQPRPRPWPRPCPPRPNRSGKKWLAVEADRVLGVQCLIQHRFG